MLYAFLLVKHKQAVSDLKEAKKENSKLLVQVEEAGSAGDGVSSEALEAAQAQVEALEAALEEAKAEASTRHTEAAARTPPPG